MVTGTEGDGVGAGGGQVQSGPRAGRNPEIEVQPVVGESPRDGYAAERGRELGTGVGQRASRPGFEDDVTVAGLRRVELQAGDGQDHPRADGAVGVVVEGVQALVLKSFFRRPAVPAFPDGGGSVFHGEQPGGKGLLFEQPVGDIEVAVALKDVEDVGRADEAGAEVVVVFLDEPHEFAGGGGAEVFGEEVEVQRKDVGGLRAAGEEAFGGDEAAPKGADDFAEEGAVAGGVVGFAEERGAAR